MKNKKEKFSLIPKITFSDSGDKKNLIKLCGDEKVILVMDYLYRKCNRDGTVVFNFRHLIESCGYTVQKGKNGANGDFINIVKKLLDDKIIKILKTANNTVFDELNVNDYIECEVCINYNTNFIVLYDNEKDKILNYKYKHKNINSVKLLMLYCYLKSKIHIRKDNDDIVKTGGKANVCFPSYETIRHDICISPNTISEYNQILHDLDLIRWDNAGLWYYKIDQQKKRIESPNTYVLYDGEDGQWKNELEEGIRQYKKLFGDERIFVGTREYKNSNRKINGKIGALTRLKNDGRATMEQLVELESLRAMLEEQREERKRIKENGDS